MDGCGIISPVLLIHYCYKLQVTSIVWSLVNIATAIGLSTGHNRESRKIGQADRDEVLDVD